MLLLAVTLHLYDNTSFHELIVKAVIERARSSLAKRGIELKTHVVRSREGQSNHNLTPMMIFCKKATRIGTDINAVLRPVKCMYFKYTTVYQMYTRLKIMIHVSRK